MRRSMLWGGGIVVICAIAVGAALIFGKPAAPYGFLAGREPLVLRKYLQEEGVTWYCYRADYDIVLKAARAELLPLGYEESIEKEDSIFVKKSSSSAPGADEVAPSVEIWRDWAINAEGKEVTRSGWVTVMVSGDPAEGPFDRLRALLGL